MENEILNELISRIKQQDADALAELYTRLKGCVYGLALVYTKSHSDAEDIVQNTFLQVWNKADSFRGKKPRSWIMTIARNMSVDFIRQNQNKTELSEDLQAPDYFSGIFESDTLKELLSKLEKDEREIVVLYSYGFSHAEISEIVKKPGPTVRGKYSRAIKKLCKISGGEGNG